MSNSLAIAAVTATLRNMLDPELTEGLPASLPSSWDIANIQVTTKPLDKARDDNTSNQINVFLYQATPNAALRNMDMPSQVKPGETGPFPTALDLHYLVTTYGNNDVDLAAQVLLGHALRILHDNAVLSRSDIKNALDGNDLYDQLERVRITIETLSFEEMSKLWASFLTNYRISAAIKASVVLIDSQRPSKAPLPVLTRGEGDVGPSVQASLIPPYPALECIVLPNHQASVQLGDTVNLRGHHLDGAEVKVVFTGRRLTDSISLDADSGATATEVKVTIPGNEPQDYPAGIYTVYAIVTRPGEMEPRTTNELSFSLAPRITTALPMTVNADDQGTVQLDLECKPEVRPEQRAALLLGHREILADPRTNQTSTLTFVIKNAPLGEHFVRLRVDGVDSLLIDRSKTPPQFFQHKINIQSTT